MSGHSTATVTRRSRRRSGERRQSTRLLAGLITAIVVTLVCILLFALLMQWLKPSDAVIRVINQVIKLVAIVAGVWTFVGHGGEKGLTRGALLGVAYMGLGVGLYALLSGQELPPTAYLADLAMGVAGGGITGAIIGGLRR